MDLKMMYFNNFWMLQESASMKIIPNFINYRNIEVD